MQKLFAMPSASTWDERADALNPKDELLRLPSTAEIIYIQAEAFFDDCIRLGGVNAANYPEIVEKIVTSSVLNHWKLVDGSDEETAVWNKVNLELMAYAGRKFPST